MSNQAPQRRHGSATASQRERNEALIRTGIEATNRGDLDAVTALLDPEIESHVASGLGNPGTWYGIDGYRTMVETWLEAFASQRINVGAIEFADDAHAVAEVRVEAVGAGSGVPVEMTLYYMLEIRDQRAVRFHIYASRDAALQACVAPGDD
jgi:ketosteroid isomerase-like protein